MATADAAPLCGLGCKPPRSGRRLREHRQSRGALADTSGCSVVGGWEGMPRAGFEPAACRLGGDRSIQLSYRGVALIIPRWTRRMSGWSRYAPAGTVGVSTEARTDPDAATGHRPIRAQN